MSQDFSKVLIRDSRLNATDDLKYAVFSGPQNNTYQHYQSQSATNSAVSFNVQVPSEATVLNRRALLRFKFQLLFNIIQTGGTEMTQADCLNYLAWGNKSALAPFPFHQIMNTAQITINNNTVSMNVQDVLALILRLHDRRELQRYNGMTPTRNDNCASYDDVIDSVSNPLGSYQECNDPDNMPRGAFYYKPSFTTVSATSKVLTLEFQVTEPLMLSPFNWLDNCDHQGMYGITNMNMVFNLSNDASRMVRYGTLGNTSPGGATGVSLVSVNYNIQQSTDCELLLNFLSRQPTDIVPSRNVLPYNDISRYLQSFNSTVNSGESTKLNSQNLQLNQVPDTIIIAVRDRERSSSLPDKWYPINNLSVNFNNASGLLSSSTIQDLYQISVENGCNLNWQEWVGEANFLAAGVPTTKPTTGSVLVLHPGKDIELNNEFAPGSIGQFNLQYSVNISNNTSAPVSDFELVTIIVNSGLFIIERGNSSVVTGILSRKDVLDANEMEGVSDRTVDRMVGGSFFNTMKSMLPVAASVGKMLARSSGNKYLNTAANVADALGFGQSGGGRSGGGQSGGMTQHLI